MIPAFGGLQLLAFVAGVAVVAWWWLREKHGTR